MRLLTRLAMRYFIQHKSVKMARVPFKKKEKDIREEGLLAAGVMKNTFTLPGEPMIYSIKYNMSERRQSVQFYRNKKLYSMLKCIFPTYFNSKTGVVLIVRFYVSPPSFITVKDKDVKSEKEPAPQAHELCEYLLSFLEILRHVLVHNYKQFVKIDCEKYYSKDPRTVFQFMKWDHYAFYKDNNTLHTETKSLGSL